MKKWLLATGVAIAAMAASPAFAHERYHYHGGTICYSNHAAHGYGYGYVYDHGYGHDRWRSSVSYHHGYYHHPHYYGHGYYRQGYRGRVSVSTHSPRLSGHVNLRF